ncbi:MAG: PBP1A family penicillin-binding protein [Desulfobacterales bacterium]|nr:PBP1A family penicillin-binding protein [Desulfobacterales bacterium]
MVKTGFKKLKIPILLIVIAGIACGMTVGAFFALTRDLPQIRSLETYKPSATTQIFSADNILLDELFVEKRDPVPLEMVPDYLKSALIATEDRNFYRHTGIDLKGILRAIVRDIWAGEFVEGASTLTQQLSKTLFLTPRKTIVRKLKEALLAFHLERRYTKDEILELYLNQVYFGSGAYGVASAARIFFSKPIGELTLAECALIAAMPKAPSRFSPLINKALARQRRDIVLRQMHEIHIITDAQYRQALAEPVLTPDQGKFARNAPYFVEYIKNFLEDDIGSDRLYKGGLTVITTLSHDLQKAADQAAISGLRSLEGRMKKNGIAQPEPQCALVALDVQTGAILAMTGGRDFVQSPFNRATMALRQPGSAFKPIVYALAVERGFSQNQTILDAPVIFKGAKDGNDWQPENFSKTYLGEITLRKALALSENIPAVRLIETLGPAAVADFAFSLGIHSPLRPNLSLALGTSEITLMDLTSAYAVFPNRGKKIQPFGVLKVMDTAGRTVWQRAPQVHLAMSRTGAAIITDMLQGVIREGTGKMAVRLTFPLGGKTGTTNDFKDALFIGFSPSIAAGVWVGNDDFTPLGRGETGARAALPAWIEFMSQAHHDRPYHYFDIPDDVVSVRMDPQTGLPAPENSKNAVSAMFRKGMEPNR